MKSDWKLCVVFILLLAFSVIFWPANPFDLSLNRINIPAGSSARNIQKILHENRILPSFSAFRIIIRLTNAHDRIRAGEYLFSPSDSLIKIIWKLAAGETVPAEEVRVTFPEGASIYRMGMIMKDNGFKHWDKFQGLVNEGITAGLREKHWAIFKYVPSESLEGYLFPDTYQFVQDASAEVMAEVMLERFEEMVMPFWDKANKDAKLTLHEILTLASIIEKEARDPAERPVIASVFYNRLKIGMPLAADPTVKYALERPTKRVYLDQLSVNSLYNTYKRKGLPPGPICNPGLESIKAAVYPAKTDSFFFVAKKDGSHIFSKTWQGHQRARMKVAIPTR